MTQLPTSPEIHQFQQVVQDYYAEHGRHDLPWRLPEQGGGFDAYKILVSELMLQQTQVSRVLPKYVEFLGHFPDVATLAGTSRGEVLKVWSGLGYNRRAKFLHQAAQAIVSDYGGTCPQTMPELVRLPGVGMNTAGAIMAYAWNRPVVFIETNIRTVFIQHFYRDAQAVADKAILTLVQSTLDHDSPREWYWALMDYGAHLKRSVGNLNHLSRSYTKQSAFQGSRRAIRGQIIKQLATGAQPRQAIAAVIQDERFDAVVADLLREGLIQQYGGRLKL